MIRATNFFGALAGALAGASTLASVFFGGVVASGALIAFVGVLVVSGALVASGGVVVDFNVSGALASVFAGALVASGGVGDSAARNITKINPARIPVIILCRLNHPLGFFSIIFFINILFFDYLG